MKTIIVLLVSLVGNMSFAVEKFKVHTYQSGESGIFANAYIVETEKNLVAIDSTLLVSTSNAFKQKIDSLKKPLAFVLLTHGHPDHYNGSTAITSEGLKIYSTSGTKKVIEDSDEEKAKQWTSMFGDEWPKKRTFPNTIVQNGQSIELDGIKFTVKDLGQGESHSDSYWIVDDGLSKSAFVGDLVLYQVHAYLSDGHSKSWLNNLKAAKKNLKAMIKIYPGHGDPGGLELLTWQEQYIVKYRDHVKRLSKGRAHLSDSAKKELVSLMKEYLPSTKLEFLIALGADPVAKEMNMGKK